MLSGRVKVLFIRLATKGPVPSEKRGKIEHEDEHEHDYFVRIDPDRRLWLVV